MRQLRGNVIQWPLRLYAGLYIVMSLAMSRNQEREADRLMVQVAGRATSQAALREIYVIGAFWSTYFERFLGMGWGMDLAPTADGFFGGFERLLAARVDERGKIRHELELPREGTLLDSHPPITTLSHEVVSSWFISLVRDAVVRAGAARWRMPWTRPVELVTSDGEVFDEEPLAADLAEASTARHAAARLTALGVDLSAVRSVSTEPSVDVGEVVAGISDMKSGDTRYDVLVLEEGLVLAEVPDDPDLTGFSRLDALVRGSSVAAMAARHRFVPFESIASAKARDWFGIKATIRLRDGTMLHLKEPVSSHRLKEDSNEVFKAQLDRWA